MNESIVEQVKTAIEPLAQKIGEGAEFLYGVYYRQTIIEAAVWGGLWLIGLITLIIASFRLNSFFRDKVREHPRDDWGAGWFFSMTILVLIGVFMVASVGQSAIKLGNPHFYTIERIIESVRAGDLK